MKTRHDFGTALSRHAWEFPINDGNVSRGTLFQKMISSRESRQTTPNHSYSESRQRLLPATRLVVADRVSSTRIDPRRELVASFTARKIITLPSQCSLINQQRSDHKESGCALLNSKREPQKFRHDNHKI